MPCSEGLNGRDGSALFVGWREMDGAVGATKELYGRPLFLFATSNDLLFLFYTNTSNANPLLYDRHHLVKNRKVSEYTNIGNAHCRSKAT